MEAQRGVKPAPECVNDPKILCKNQAEIDFFLVSMKTCKEMPEYGGIVVLMNDLRMLPDSIPCINYITIISNGDIVVLNDLGILPS